MTHKHTESWTANKRPAWLTKVQDKFRKQEIQERNLTLDYMTKLTQPTQLIWLDVRELSQVSIWLAAWPQQSTRQMPTELILDSKAEKKQSQTQAPSKPRLLNNAAEWTIMVGQDDKQRIEWMIIKWCCLSCLYSFDSRKSDSWSSPRATHRECTPNTTPIYNKQTEYHLNAR